MAAQSKPKADSKRGQRNGDRKNGKAFKKPVANNAKGGAAGHTLAKLKEMLTSSGQEVNEHNLILLRVELRKKKNEARRAASDRRKNERSAIPVSRPGSAPVSKILWG